VLYDAYDGFPKPTGYFGPITEAALKQWQSEHGIVSSGSAKTTGYGTFGPRTAAAMHIALCANDTSQPTATPTSKEASAQLLLAQVKVLQEKIAALLAGKASQSGPVAGAATSSVFQSGSVSCGFNGTSVANGQNVTAYQSATVPAGQQCVSQVRTCMNGTLSGTYLYSSCTAGNSPVTDPPPPPPVDTLIQMIDAGSNQQAGLIVLKQKSGDAVPPLVEGLRLKFVSPFTGAMRIQMADSANNYLIRKSTGEMLQSEM
jgi:peptidoglycan hydrolase-like protein with peptidoglycan-binding domain